MSEPEKVVNGKDAGKDGEENKESETKENDKRRPDVRNPLTMIGIFASIAEGAGAAVLPFIDKSLHGTYMWFIIGFPTLLVILFFLTLNFNNVKLYAPDDFDTDVAFLALNATSRQLKEVAGQLGALKNSVVTVKSEIEAQETVTTLNTARLQESLTLQKSPQTLDLLGTQSWAPIQEMLNLQADEHQKKLAESKDKIDTLSNKLEDTIRIAERYTQVTEDIQRLRKNPKKLLDYLVDSSLKNISA